ncbi:MAG: thioredoxin family protein [Candidatus Aminicenantes bacterium]|nr:thioredoxin family protein [Candidatus Aminicenantes bacterium]
MKKTAIMIILIFMVCALAWASGQDAEKQGTSSAKMEAKAESKILVTFIELGSVRCIPCRKMIPIMEEVEKEYGHQVKVVFHDVWTEKGKPYAKKHGIKLIPTQIFLDEKGNEYFRHVGFFPKEKLVEVLKQKGVKARVENTKKDQGGEK